MQRRTISILGKIKPRKLDTFFFLFFCGHQVQVPHPIRRVALSKVNSNVAWRRERKKRAKLSFNLNEPTNYRHSLKSSRCLGQLRSRSNIALAQTQFDQSNRWRRRTDFSVICRHVNRQLLCSYFLIILKENQQPPPLADEGANGDGCKKKTDGAYVRKVQHVSYILHYPPTTTITRPIPSSLGSLSLGQRGFYDSFLPSTHPYPSVVQMNKVHHHKTT